ncbi:FxSxx-COOH system tetratricopeptide repeat protein [Micromonospora sp. WMMD1102]|uniref:FxSxx-COOH system tetratricopeptide repeat protein n=1 Tax=Micromonospora sp. WMMD1102 TaxID=3016105 RepID=UPI002415121C|nr:FxSxx-COOH system tetratricopeptide repeat protein [Micromonospora sp. WMMD1102]MDG4785158.1 FxSxx-COOH system tetratricopeptide repeat protein [Micromonospora sp. WMMD1102]
MNLRTGVAAQPQVVSFLGAADPAGHATAIANVAVLLALAGERVLVVTPGQLVVRRLHPFPAVGPPPERVHPRIRQWLTRPPSAARGTGSSGQSHLVRYALPDTDLPLDVIAPGVPTPAPTASVDGALPPTDYDVVLVDRPAGSAPPGGTGPDADVVVLCVPTAGRTHREIGDLTWSLLREAGPAPRVVVGARSGGPDHRPAGQLRASIERTVTAFRSTNVDIVEVDPDGYQVDGDGLVVYLAPPPGSGPDDPTAAGPETGLGRYQGYDRLAAAVRGRTTGLVPAVRPRTPARYRRALGIGPAARREVVYLAYAVADRPWADRISDQLGLAGALVRRLPATGDWWREETDPALVMIGAPAGYPGEIAAQARRAEPVTDVVYVDRPGDQPDPLSPPPPGARWMSPAPDDPTSVERLLLAHFGLSPAPGPPARTAAAIPVPGRPTNGTYEFPQRNAGFVGRESDLEALRDELRTPADGPSPLLRVGVAGVGKSELVREYVNRFAYDYDVVWWVPGDNSDAVRASLSRLSARIEPRVQAGDISPAASVALERLTADRPTGRWLLVYDNVDDLAAIDDLRPTGGSGRVVVTSRSVAPDPVDGAVLEPLDRADSLTLLNRDLAGLAPDDAEWLADWAGHLPLSLRLAAKWLRHRARAHSATGLLESTATARAVTEYRQRISEASAALAPTAGAGGPAPVTAAITVTVGAMRSDPAGRLPVQLAQVCAFLSPEGASLALLRSRPMLASLTALASADGAQLAADSIELDRVLWTAAQFGLVEVSWSADLVRMHRLVAHALRAAMESAERDLVREYVLRGLAEYAPSDAEDHVATDRHRLTELRRHLEPSGALNADDRSVRRWVVAQVQHTARYGDRPAWEAMIRLAEETQKRWWEQPRGDEDLRLRLGDHIADLYRKLGRSTAPTERDLRRERREQARPDDLRVLLARLGHAAELREQGWFRDALVEDNAAHEAFLRVVGEEHPDTLMARHDLALSWFLNGDARTARDLEATVLKLREEQFGWADPRTWRAAGSLGAYQRELGDPEAQSRLGKAWEKAREIGSTPSVAAALTIRRNLAVLQRKSDPARALDITRSVVEEYVDLLSTDHPQTWAARLTLAADHNAVNRSAEAARQADTVLSAFRQCYPEGHPFIGLCLVNLGVFLFTSGRGRAARKAVQEGLDLLEARFDVPHPWTLAARINQLPMRTALGESVEPVWAELSVACRDFLPQGHPYTAVADNHGPFIVIEVPPT